MSNDYAQKRVSAAGDHRPSHRQAVEIDQAAELLTARMSGRHLGGGPVTVEYNPGSDTSYWSKVCAEFIEKHPDYGVTLVRK